MSLKFVSEDKKRVRNISELKNQIQPTEERVVFVESTTNDIPTFFYWDSQGDPSNANGETAITSSVGDFAPGGGNEGLWRRGVFPADAATTDDIPEGNTNKYFENSRALQAVDGEIYESATRLYVDKETGDDPPVDYDPNNFNTLPGRNEANAFETISRAIEEIRQNIRTSTQIGVAPDPIEVYVAAGLYTVDNPVSLPKRIGLRGDGLRTTILFPQNPKADLFHVRDRNFIQLFRMKDLQHPAFAIAFPSVVVETDTVGGEVTAANITYSPDGYECDYDNVFSKKYPEVQSDNDLPAPQRVGQLASVNNNSELKVYEVVSNSGVLKWEVFASKENNTISSDNIILPLKPEARISDPRGEETNAEVDITIANGKVDSATVTTKGGNYRFNPMVSIPAPVAKQAYVIGSPYTYNSSSITGPYTERDPNTGNREKIPETMPLPYDLDNPGTDPISGKTINRAVDQDGSGGGTKVDGRVTFGNNKISKNHPKYQDLPSSPLKSMVAAQFTQVNQGGPGHLLMNDAFAQYVSCFTTFSNYSYRCQSGGFALLSNSVSDFGLEGLVAEGKFDDPYTSGDITTDDSSFVSSVKIVDGGTNYDQSDTISIGGSASVSMTVINGEIIEVSVDDQGSGYTSKPDITVSTSTGSGAEFDVDMDKVATVNIENLDQTTSGNQTRTRKPIQGTTIEISGQLRDIVSWVERGDGTIDVTFAPGVFTVTSGNSVQLYQSSRINSSGHAFEFPGSGTTYNALPEYGGVTDVAKETIEIGTGNVFVTSNDQRGNFRVGNSFKVDQTTGTVTIDTDQFNLSGLNAIGPFKVSGNEVGVQLREVSDRGDLTSQSGFPGNTVPTVSAVKTALPEEVFDVIRNKIQGGTDIDVTATVNNDLIIDFAGTSKINIEDSGSSIINTTGINFNQNLTAADDGDGTVTVDVDSLNALTTDDLTEGSGNLYFTESRVYNASKSQIVSTSNTSIQTDDAAEEIKFDVSSNVVKKSDFVGGDQIAVSTNGDVTIDFTGDRVGFIAEPRSPQSSDGSDGDLFIDTRLSPGAKFDRELFLNEIRDIFRAPGSVLLTETDFQADQFEFSVDFDRLSTDLLPEVRNDLLNDEGFLDGLSSEFRLGKGRSYDYNGKPDNSVGENDDIVFDLRAREGIINQLVHQDLETTQTAADNKNEMSLFAALDEMNDQIVFEATYSDGTRKSGTVNLS